MRKLFLAVAGCIALAAAACSPGKVNTGVANADALLRDKCNYAVSAIGIARVASAFIPSAAPIVDVGAPLITAYCSGGPVTDVADAMKKLQEVIDAVVPVAEKLKR